MKKNKLLAVLLALAMTLSLLPTAAFATVAESDVAKIGENGYATLDDAIRDAKDGDTITILKAAEVESGYKLNGNLTYSDKAITIKAADGVNVAFDMSAAVALHGAKITFEGVTFEYGTADYIGLQHTSQLTYNRCIINGKVFLYAEDEIFNECEFNAKKNKGEADYNVWTYGAKNVTFNKCTFNCDGKAVLVYNEGNGSTDKTDLKVTDTTFTASAPVAGKAAIEIDTSLMKGQTKITVDQATAEQTTGFGTGSNSGSSLWNDKKQTAETNENTTVVVAGTTVFAPPVVAKVGDKEFTSLAGAFAALNETNHTLRLIKDSAWDAEKPVYWEAGNQSDYAATLTDALKDAYMADEGAITIVCRPDADVGTMTHGHVADDLTIYGNNAYISGGECDLEVDTYKFDRTTGAQAADGVTLDKNITITGYKLYNLGVWGQRTTGYTVNVKLIDCDGKAIEDKDNVQRVYISGTTGVNNVTLTGCDFITKKCPIYSNADGTVMIDNCSFTGSQVPVNFNHKANGTQTVTVQNCTFENCGSTSTENKLNQYAAPIRFVNSGNGTSTTTVDSCTFKNTVGTNGDILIGDGRAGEASKDVSLTVENTAANVQAQQPGYYGGESTDDTKKGSKNVAASDTFTSSIEEMISKGMADYVVVGGIKGFEDKKFASFTDAYEAIKPELEKLCGNDALGQGVATAEAFDALFTSCDANGNATLTYTIVGNVTYDETSLNHLLTMGRKASHYGNDRHLINFKFVGGSNDKTKDTLTVNSNITLPYEWWGEKTTTSISFEDLTITGSAPNGLYTYQPYFEGIDFKVNNCTLRGIKIYNCANVGGSYTITNSTLDGTGAAANAYAIHLQGHETAPLKINISGNTISGYDRGINIDQKTANATISSNTISVNDKNRSCIQLTRLATTTVSGNTLNLTGGNALTFHEELAESSKINFTGNTVNGTGYLIYDNTKNSINLTYSSNTVASTVDTTKGIYKGSTKELTKDVDAVINPAPNYSGGSSSGGGGGSSTTTPSQPTTSTETKPDGSTTTTESKPDGTVTESNTSKPTTDASGNTSQTTTETTTGKDGVTESKTETVTKPDGSASSTTESTTTKPDGTKTESTTETTINKDGSTASTTTSTTTGKDGTVTESKTEATTSTVTNKDGSTTETKQETTTTSTGSKTESTTVTTVNKDGSSTATTTATTIDKAGTVTESKTESTTNKNGTTTEKTSTTKTKANGTVTESKTETTINKDGSSKATTTETVTKADGTKVESKTTATTSLSTNKSTGTVTETKKETTTTSDGVKSEGTTVTQIQKDGTVTSKETVKASDSNGTTATKTTTLDAKGNVTTAAEAAVSAKAVTEAAKTGEAVTIPVEVAATKSASTAPTVSVSVPKTAESVKVELPVQNVTPGTVAVIVNADGTEKIVSTSVVTDNGVALTLDGSATVKLVDNSKSFKDVPNTNVFYNEISSLSAREIMIGKTGDKFDLHNSVTLNQTANVAGRITGAVDVSDFNAGVAWGQANGLKIGNVAATRGDVLKALYIAAGSPAVEDTTILSRFKDSASIPADMAAIAAWAAQNGILKGNMDGSAGLGNNVTRGQACALAGRTMGTLA